MLVDAETQQQQQADEERRQLAEQQRLLDVDEVQPQVIPRRLSDQPESSRRAATGNGADATPQPPDGGWGWLVAVAVAFICIVTMGPAMAAPFVFADYLEEIGQGSQGMTTLLSVWMSVSCFSGLLCNKLFQRFSCRQVGWIGAALLAIGQGPVAFATHFAHFVLAYISGGLGMGLVVTACFTSFNIYFNRKRTLAMGFTQLIMGLGMFGFPMIVQKMVEHFGFRMAQCIICAINMSIIPVLTVLKPLKRKARGRGAETGSDSQNSVNSMASTGNTRTHIAMSLSVDHINDRTVDENNSKRERFNTSLNHLTSATQNVQVAARGENKNLLKPENETQEQSFGGSAAKLRTVHQPDLPVSSKKNAALPNVPASDRNNNRRSCWLRIVDFFDLQLMQDFTIANTLVGLSLMFFVDMMFITVIPLHLFHTGFSRSDSALAMSVMTFADMGGRLSMAIIGACGVTKNRILFLVGSSSCAFFRTMLIFFTDFTSIIVLSVLMGFSRSYLTSPMPLVIGETCSKERFPAAYGIHSVMSGILYISVGPLIGLLKDMTKNFVTSIITLDVIALLCIIPWILEMIVTYKRKRDKLQPAI